MPSISCFYNNYDRNCFKFIFIEFENYIKVVFNCKAIILKKEDLALNKKLLQIYVLSLILTKDTSTINSIIDEDTKKIIYGILTIWYWKELNNFKRYQFSMLEKASSKNPLKAAEPKRASGDKKIKKFFKSFDKIFDSLMINEAFLMVKDFIQEFKTSSK
jgi:hypothetical protein